MRSPLLQQPVAWTIVALSSPMGVSVTEADRSEGYEAGLVVGTHECACRHRSEGLSRALPVHDQQHAASKTAVVCSAASYVP